MRSTRSRRLGRAAAILATALVSSLVVIGPAPAAEIASATGSAFGFRENISKVETPLVTAAVPPGKFNHDNDAQADVGGGTVQALEVVGDACLDGGVQANLQAEMDAARRQARGEEPPPEDQETPRQTVQAPENYGVDNFCLTPQNQQLAEDPNLNPKCEEYADAEVPDGGAPPVTCQALMQLWNARGYGEALDVLGFQELRSEAVGRCVGAAPEYMTGAQYLITGDLQADPSTPNQNLDPLALGLAESSTVIFWETNWDPKTNSITDGKDHVWVNAMHVITPTEDIIIGHSEAKVECAGDPVPAGGYPRDINLTPSKGIVTYDRVFNMSGSVTPATEFNTPRSCVEGVDVTIRRDIIGGDEDFESVATVTTDKNGNFTYNATADFNSQWIAYIDKDTPANCAQVASSSAPVLVKPFVGLKTSRNVVRHGQNVKLTARLEPCIDKAGTRMKLRRVYSSRNVKIDTKLLDSDCRAVFYQTGRWKGTAVFDAAWPKQDTVHQNGNSRPKAVRVKRG